MRAPTRESEPARIRRSRSALARVDASAPSWAPARMPTPMSAVVATRTPGTAELLGPHEDVVAPRARALDSRRNAVRNEEQPAHPHVVSLRAGPGQRSPQPRAHEVDPRLPCRTLPRGD